MRVVFDTVILVRSLLDPYSWSGRLLFARNDAYEWVVSPEIAAEYLQVITRPRLVSKYRTVEHRDLPVILSRIATATLVHPIDVPAICRDPSDDKFLAAALFSGCRFIVSEDADLLDIGTYEGMAILSAEEFPRMLASGSREQ